MLTWENIPGSPLVYIFVFRGSLGMRLVNTQFCAENLILLTFISWGSIDCVVLSMEESPESTKSLTTLRWRHLSLHWGQVFWWASHWVRLQGGEGGMVGKVLVVTRSVMCMPHLPVHPSEVKWSLALAKWVLCSRWLCASNIQLPGFCQGDVVHWWFMLLLLVLAYL